MATMMLVVLVTMALDTLCKLSPHKHTLSHYQQPAPEPPATSRSPERRKNPIFSGRGEAGAASGDQSEQETTSQWEDSTGPG